MWQKATHVLWGGGIERYTVNSKSGNRYHANWMNMMYPRLKLAKELLSVDGVIFISIDDNEVDNLKNIANEIFGEENFVAQCIWKSKPQGGNDNKYIITEHEYILVYACSIGSVKLKGKMHGAEKYSKIDEHVEERGKYATSKLDLSTLEYRVNLDYEIICPDGSRIYPGNVEKGEWEQRKNGNNSKRDWQWRWSQDRLEKALSLGLIEFRKNGNQWNIYTKEYEKMDYDGNIIERFVKYRTIFDETTTINGTSNIKQIFDNRIFTYPKPVELIYDFCNIGGNGDYSIILDFFSGSSTTAHAVMQLNAEDGGHRKFIMVQLPEVTSEDSEAYKAGYKNICEIGKERIRRAGDKIKEEHPDSDVDIGFKVFRAADTNIKWNSRMSEGQLDLEQIESTPDLLDFMPGAKDIDIVYELMLRQRDVALSETLEKLSDIGERTYLYASSFLVCLETEITESLIEKVAALDPLPIKFIFRDSAFKDEIALKDETFRRLKALAEKNAGNNKPTYTVEFI